MTDSRYVLGRCGACDQAAVKFPSGVWAHVNPTGCAKAHAKPDADHPAIFVAALINGKPAPVKSQAIGDMLDDLDSTRVKLRLAAARRRLWSIVATSQEDAAAGRAHPVSQPPPSAPDDDVPSGGFQ